MAMKHPTAKPGSSVGDPLPPGSKIGRYEVVDLLGGGGMGMVYRAVDTRLQREVAIKVLHEKESVPGMRERLIREARAVSAINHPSICTLYDIGEQTGDPYLVMELLQGETLRDRMRRKPLSAQEIVEYSLQIADALAEAHKNNIIHRDIKPANIFLCSKATGAVQVKVLDFGLAKRHTDGMDTDSLNLTGPGTTIGTISYMSPEQARGEPLDIRTDLFSFGTVMYEMATNSVPFNGQTSAMVFVELLERDPKPVRELNRAIPLQLVAIINKALYKDINARYQSAVEIHTDLEAIWSEVWASSQVPSFESAASTTPVRETTVLATPAPTPITEEHQQTPAAPRIETASSPTGPVSRELPPALPTFSQDSSPAYVPTQLNRTPLPQPPLTGRAQIAASSSTSGAAPSAVTPAATPNESLPVHRETSETFTVASSSGRRQRLSDTTGRVRVQAQAQSQSSEKARAQAEAKRKDRARLRLLYFVGIVIIGIIATAIYIQFVRTTVDNGLHQNDLIGIGRIENKTDSTKLDHTFRVGLGMALMQSPFVNTQLAADNAPSVPGERGMLVGSISGTVPYVVDLRVIPPNGGKAIAEVQDTAQDLDSILATIDRVTLELRRQAG